MNKKYVVLIVAMVLFAGIFHMLFIMFDYAFHDPDDGAFVKLREAANETITNEPFRKSVDNNTVMLRDAFGYGRIICIALVPIICIIGITRKPSIQG